MVAGRSWNAGRLACLLRTQPVFLESLLLQHSAAELAILPPHSSLPAAVGQELCDQQVAWHQLAVGQVRLCCMHQCCTCCATTQHIKCWGWLSVACTQLPASSSLPLHDLPSTWAPCMHMCSLSSVCRVRVVGGAYGGFCDFDTHSGMFTYSSYRDPNLLKTVDVYDGGCAPCLLLAGGGSAADGAAVCCDAEPASLPSVTSALLSYGCRHCGLPAQP